jgi:hypothetical protein
MRTLTSTLLAAQKQASAMPYIKVEAADKIAGVDRYVWTRLYNGLEDDCFHALTIPGDGSLFRVKITPVSDSRKLYYQRVANPSPESNFSQWTYSSQYGAVATAVASLNAEVSIFWVRTNREIHTIKSTNYGVSFGNDDLFDYFPTTVVSGIAAGYKPNGDIAVFLADSSTLYVMKRINGTWQTQTAWDKSTGNLSGVACNYDGDWNLLVAGKDASGNYKLWSLVYGDGGDFAAGTWSSLKEIASAPSGGDFEYKQPFLDKTDVHRAFFLEKFSGIEAYARPFRIHMVPGTHYCDGLWC